MSDTTNAAPVPSGAAAPEVAPAPKTAFTVVQQPVLEDGKYYLKNQTVLLTADRAKALGDWVKPVPPAKTIPVVPPSTPQKK